MTEEILRAGTLAGNCVWDGAAWQRLAGSLDGALIADLYGWDGASRRKLTLLWGYTDTYEETFTSAVHPAGTVVLILSTVPAGQIWIVKSIYAKNASSATSSITIASASRIAEARNVPVDTPFNWTGEIILKAGNDIKVTFYNTALNDSLRVDALGYKMQVA